MTGVQDFFEEFLNIKKGDWVWCLHCGQCFKWDGVSEFCQYSGCDGSSIDFSKWAGDSLPRHFHPEYPEIPIEGVYYSEWPTKPS